MAETTPPRSWKQWARREAATTRRRSVQRAVRIGLLQHLHRVTDADGAGPARRVRDEVNAEPHLAVPAPAPGQRGDRLLALDRGVGIDGGQHAPVAALDGAEPHV